MQEENTKPNKEQLDAGLQYDLSRESEIDKLYDQLQDAVKQRNRMTLSEFEEFAPLFVREELKTMDKKDIYELCRTWRETISLFEPVEIVSDENTEEVILKLPPMFAKIDSLNSLDIDQDRILNGFSNAMKDAQNPVSLRPEKMTNVIAMCLRKAASLKEKESFETYRECMDSLIGEKTDDSFESSVSKDDYEWEDDA